MSFNNNRLSPFIIIALLSTAFSCGGTSKSTSTKKSNTSVSTPWEGNTQLLKAPSLASPTSVAPLQPQRILEKNGLTVEYLKNENPLVHFFFSVPLGEANDPFFQRGLSRIAAPTLEASNLSRRLLLQLGGTTHVDVQHGYTLFHCSVAADLASACVDYLESIQKRADVDVSFLQSRKQKLTTEVQRYWTHRGGLADIHLQNRLWGNSARGLFPRASTIQSISDVDVEKWHKTAFNTRGAHLTILGPSAPSVKPMVKKRRLQTPSQKDRPSEKNLSNRKRWVQVNGSATYFRVGVHAPGVKSPQYPAAVLAAFMLGDTLSPTSLASQISQLSDSAELRVRLDRAASGGLLSIEIDAPTKDEKLILEHIQTSLFSVKFTAKQFAEAKNRILWHLLTAYQTNSARAEEFATYRALGSEIAPRGLVAAVQNVTMEETNKVLQSFVKEHQYWTVLSPSLANEGFQSYTADADPLQSIYQMNPSSRTTNKKVIALLKKALRKQGPVKRIRSIYYQASGQLRVPGSASLPVQITRKAVFPEQLRLELKFGQKRVLTVRAGQNAWIRENGKTTRVPTAGIADLKRNQWADSDRILLHLNESLGNILDYAKTKQAHRIRVAIPEHEAIATLYIDRKTYRLIRLETSHGNEHSIEEFADFRKLGGVWFPHKRTSNNSQASMLLEFSEIRIGETFAADTFSDPK